jgi:hypothetical protein
MNDETINLKHGMHWRNGARRGVASPAESSYAIADNAGAGATRQQSRVRLR